MKKIVAKMEPDLFEPYSLWGHKIPIVVKSNHPKYTSGIRLDWGYVQVALDEGYIVEIKP